MKVTQKKVDGGKYLLDCVASEEDVSKAFYTASVEFASQMGLRPQKDVTVEQACREQLGITDLDSMVQGRALELIAPMALDKKDIIPLFPPTPMGTTELKRGKKFAFTMTVTPKPAYELTSYDPVEFTFPAFAPDLSSVDEQLQHIAEQYAGYTTSEVQHEVRSGDTCLISIDASSDGVPLTGLNTDGRPYTAGEGFMPPQFDEAVIGMKPGEKKTFTFEAPDWDPEKGEFTQVVNCTVEVKEIQEKQTPDINDEWVQTYMPMYRNLDDFRHSLEEQMTAMQREQYNIALRNQAASALSSRFEGSIADEAYEITSKMIQDNLRKEIAAQGLTWDQFVEENGGAQQVNMLMMMQTRQQLVTGFALDAIFRKKKLVVSEEDIVDACKSMNPQYPSRVRKELEETGRNFVLRESAERLCAAKYLVKHAIIHEPAQDTEEAQASAPEADAPQAEQAAKTTKAAKKPKAAKAPKE